MTDAETIKQLCIGGRLALDICNEIRAVLTSQEKQHLRELADLIKANGGPDAVRTRIAIYEAVDEL